MGNAENVLLIRDQELAKKYEEYIQRLMSQVESDQRWGVSAAASPGAASMVKNGWLPDPLTGRWHVNSIGAFRSLGAYRSRDISYQIAILTDGNRSESYGIGTIQAAARVINHDIARG